MQIYRIERPSTGYTLAPNTLIRDPAISAKSKGIWVGLASHRDGFTQTLDAIAKMHSDGKAAIGSGLRELEVAGYITRRQQRDAQGRHGEVLLTLVDRPQRQPQPQTDFPSADNPSADNPSADNRTPIRRLREEEQEPEKTKESTPRGGDSQSFRLTLPPGAPKPFRDPISEDQRMTPNAVMESYIAHTDKDMRATHAVWIVAHWTAKEIQHALTATANASASFAYFKKVIESPIGRPRLRAVPDLAVGGHDEGAKYEETPQKRSHGAEWARVLVDLEDKVPANAIATWLAPCDLVDGRLDAPSDFHAEWVAEKYQDMINEAVGREVLIWEPREVEAMEVREVGDE